MLVSMSCWLNLISATSAGEKKRKEKKMRGKREKREKRKEKKRENCFYLDAGEDLKRRKMMAHYGGSKWRWW